MHVTTIIAQKTEAAERHARISDWSNLSLHSVESLILVCTKYKVQSTIALNRNRLRTPDPLPLSPSRMRPKKKNGARKKWQREEQKGKGAMLEFNN